MTDNEIIKALECCIEDDYDKSCTECPLQYYEYCNFQLAKFALDLINRQKEDIEKLTEQCEFHRQTIKPMRCQYCGTEPNNATAKKGLYVCCCSMLHFHKRTGEYIQHHKDRKPTTLEEMESETK